MNKILQSGVAVTPNDSTDLTVTSALYVGSGGDVKVDFVETGTVTFSNVADRSFLPIIVTKVYATGTTASNIIGIY